jgi:tripartite-type tricarboxylate transporter receptor subunit TctC
MKTFLKHFLGIIFSFCIIHSVTANTWPDKGVRIIVPFPAGGATDVPARILADRLSKIWRQPVIIENKTGAGGAIGAAEAARSPSDGYTLFFPSGSVMTVNQFIYPKLGYDPEKDFRPITNFVTGPLVVVVPQQSQFINLESLISFGQKNPTKLSFAHAGIGSQSHLANELFLQQAKFEATGIPYKGDPPAVADLIGGSVNYSVISLGASLPHIKSGKLRALAVTSKDEISQLPGVKPVSAIIPNYENMGWFGLVAPAGVPQGIINKIYESIQIAINDPQLRSQLEGAGFRIVANKPDQMAESMTAERKKWEVLVRDRNLRQN